MSRANKGPRLYLRKGRIKADKALPAIYFIRDGQVEIGTGCGPDRLPEAERALSDYIATKWSPPPPEIDDPCDPTKVLVAEVLALYATERAPKLATDPRSTAGFIKNLVAWWGCKSLSDVKRSTCLAYVAYRTSQTNSRAKGRLGGPAPRKISDQTARRELETLSAAIGYWNGEHTLTTRPIVTLPDRPESPRDALTRPEAAALLKAALGSRRGKDGAWTRPEKEHLGAIRANRAHLRRAILIGIYTGSRPGVVRTLLWEESATSPWVDLNAGMIFRRGRDVREQKTKPTPVVKLPPRLLTHMRRWRRLDQKREAALRKDGKDVALNSVIRHFDKPLSGKIRTGFEGCVRDAGLNPEISPHWLRHTAATWLMENGVDLWTAAGFLGMTMATLEKHYGHHRPDYQADAAGSYSRRSR
jgi:integrase